MTSRPTQRRRALLALLSAAVVSTTVTSLALPAQAAPAAVSDPAAAASQRLQADGGGGVTLTRDASGRVTFVGTSAGAEIDNPAVSRGTSVADAARAHLDRYGAALGAGRKGTSLVQRQVVHTVAGTDAVTFTQQVGGLPVIGGDVVVTVAEDRDLVSVLSTLSSATVTSRPTVSEQDAADTALVVARRHGATGDLRVDDLGRWVLDPTVIGGADRAGARTVHRLEVTNDADVSRLVLVDDRTGQVALTFDDIKHIDRVVCDNGNVKVASESPCTSGFARTETGPASTVADVNDAFTFSGQTSAFYQQVGGLDLTQLLGIDVGGTKKLASTVRLCFTGEDCPYENAFWNGSQMYYGADFAKADDVVGHEMTHGVVDRFSQLFYWGQSGAMNESLADIMGEIIDHRNGTDDDSAWALSEDLPIGAIRSMSDPTSFGDPDSMTSDKYFADTADYGDNGGVHYNSGVGNKTAYLMSAGGSLNGVTVTGIDTGDPALTKSAKLYLYAIQSLTSGSDYADLARVLTQGCQSMVGTGGFTAATCAQVANAVAATRLTTTPTNAPQPADAPTTCATGLKRVLFDSESGAPSAGLTAGTNWVRGSSDYWGSNATSGLDSWFNAQEFSGADMTPTRQSLALATALAVPTGQPTYLSFNGWYVTDYGSNAAGTTEYYDGGTVEVVDQAAPATAVDTASLSWDNGPSRALDARYGNPAGGRKAFAGDSFGWVRSRLDLSSFAGRTVKPQFTMSYDNSITYPGWWLDDITVYTCDPVPAVTSTGAPSVSGSAVVGQVLTAVPGSWSPSDVSFAYQWLRGGVAVAGATGATYVVSASDVGSTLSVRVTGSKPGYDPASATSAPTASVTGTVVAGAPSVSGSAVVGQVLTAVPGSWSPSDVSFAYQWLRGGVAVAGATGATYVVSAADVGSALSVRVTGSKSGYLSATATSAATSVVAAPPAPPQTGTVVPGTPTVVGKAKVGRSLTARSGTWAPADVVLGYTWLRNGKVVAGATGTTYRLTAKDAGKRIAVRVTGTRAGWTPASATSAATKVKAKGKPDSKGKPGRKGRKG